MAHAESVRLPATADIWLSDANASERNTSMGAAPRLKLKAHQELSAIRFNATAIQGREVKSARLWLRKAGEDKLRYVRISTINQDWNQGRSERSYGPADGATWLYADSNNKKSWGWPGSGFCDVIMTSGHSLAGYGEIRREKDDWISVDVSPELVYALAIGDTDGLALMDGGNLALFNNFLFSHEQKDSAPYLEVEVGDRLNATPAAPAVSGEAAADAAHLGTGAIRLQIASDANTFCFRVKLDGVPLARWKIPHPRSTGAPRVTLVLDDLAPNKNRHIEVTAVSASGQASPPASITIESSPALPPAPTITPAIQPSPAKRSLPFKILPPLVKTSPDAARPLNDDLNGAANSIWDGQAIHLLGARGEYVSFQIVAPDQQPAVRIADLTGPENVELFFLHVAKNHDKQPQPAYAVPLRPGDKAEGAFVHFDLYIPKDAKPGRHAGTLTVTTDRQTQVPIDLTVYDFTLPDELCFWPELNGYSIPKNHLDYFRLAHQHRCIPNLWKFEPAVHGHGDAIEIDWSDYDRRVGPLLSGQAFKNSRRGPVPAEVMYLPYSDNWPTNLTKETYHYGGYWPHRGDDKKFLVEHSMTSPPIDRAFSPDYLAAFRAVQRQFVDHFQQQGWNRTEMQCYFGGKQSHRINFGSNYWWSTDEPAFWHDWLALQFFDRQWTQGLSTHRLWPARADISRPQWQGDTLDGVTQVIYYGAGAASDPAMIRRTQIHAKEGPVTVRHYGSCNPDTESNLVTIAWEISAYLDGAGGVVPWQTLGSEKALDDDDAGAFGGNALLVPATRFNQPVVADLRLKALRDGEQIVEYLNVLAQRRHLNREQLRAMVGTILPLGARSKNPNAPTADTDRFVAPKEWQLTALRRGLAELITSTR
ncbi:MAG TPA: hypothetical protein VH475_08720 [Tepidisphaeraceae bacterium]